MKRNILFTIIGIIIGTTITVGAAYVYSARDISYTPQDENWSVTNANDALTSLKSDLDTINNKVEGIERVYKAGEVNLVGNTSDDSFYKDSNGKYVLANSTTGVSLLSDTENYKSLASTDDCVGIVGQDTCSDFTTFKTSGTLIAKSEQTDDVSGRKFNVELTEPGYYVITGWSFAAGNATRDVVISGNYTKIFEDTFAGFGKIKNLYIYIDSPTTINFTLTCYNGNHRTYGYEIFKL